MGCVKKLGMIFLAIYLIISGLIALGGINLPTYIDHARQLCAVVSGILILISIGTFTGKHTCGVCEHEHQG
ncbi:MAG: hypothetical protein JSR46_10730 [Verrucomicrobia bacterium]|nr:hypothetical protein [Verrucomicrobiota bacterium]